MSKTDEVTALPRRGRILVGLLAVAAPAAVLATRLALGALTPDPMPTHWSLSGAVNGTMPASGYFAMSVAVCGVLAVAVMALLRRQRSAVSTRMTATLLMAVSALIAAIYVGSCLLARGAARAVDVRLPWWMLLLTILVAVVIGAACWRLLPASWPVRATIPVRALDLGPTERVVWVGSARARGMVWVMAALAAAGLVLVFVNLLVAAAAILLAILVLTFGELTVRIDERGLHTLWGPFGFPRSRLPLTEIAVVGAETIEPMQWGGWGLRITPRGRAAVVRRGPGLVVRRVSGPAYAVTVDDARTGAQVLSALVSRSGR